MAKDPDWLVAAGCGRQELEKMSDEDLSEFERQLNAVIHGDGVSKPLSLFNTTPADPPKTVPLSKLLAVVRSLNAVPPNPLRLPFRLVEDPHMPPGTILAMPDEPMPSPVANGGRDFDRFMRRVVVIREPYATAVREATKGGS